MLDVSGTVCHVANPEDRTNLIHKTTEKYQKIDCLVLSAGINPYVGPLFQTPESNWDRIFDVNVMSPLMFAREIMPYLEKTKGSIISISDDYFDV